MKVFFLVPRLDKASTRYRVLQYVSFLEQEGIVCEIRALSRTSREWFSLVRQIRAADVVFVQKKLFTPAELLLVRRLARRLVYDFDDAVMYKDGPASERQHARQRRRFSATVRRADLVVAGNRYLLEQARSFNQKAYVLPTVLDMDRYREKPTSAAVGGEVVLGWIGSRGTLRYLRQIAPALEEIGRQFPQVKLKIVADDFFDLERMPVIKKRWSAEEEIADLHSFDIGLMPLADDIWTRGKCGFKLLQCMAVGLPVVCSPIGVNAEIVADGIEGFWATSPQEWAARMGELVTDPSLRRTMGERGREKVRSAYSLEANAPLFLRLLRGELPES